MEPPQEFEKKPVVVIRSVGKQEKRRIPLIERDDDAEFEVWAIGNYLVNLIAQLAGAIMVLIGLSGVAYLISPGLKTSGIVLGLAWLSMVVYSISRTSRLSETRLSQLAVKVAERALKHCIFLCAVS